MTTTGTFAFAPSLGEVGLNAFSRIGIRGPALLAEHMHQLSIEANLLQAEWSNKGPNLWAVDKQTVTLIAGTATYSVPAETVMILDAYVTVSIGSNAYDRVILPVSRSEYASYPNKTQQGATTVFWYDRLVSQTVTLWPVPDANATYTLNYYRFRQIQDASLAGGLNVEVPYLWLDALAAGLSHRLSRHFAPSLEQLRKVDAAEAYTIAADQGTENVTMYISPVLGNFYQ